MMDATRRVMAAEVVVLLAMKTWCVHSFSLAPRKAATAGSAVVAAAA